MTPPNNYIPISFLELKAKIEYLKEIGSALVQENGTLHPIFVMNSKKLQEETGMSLIELEDKYIEDSKQIMDELLEIDSYANNYAEAQAYYEDHGNLAVPASFDSLGLWISKQRTNYKDHKLEPEKIRDLNAIGMIWDKPKNQIAVDALCEENGCLVVK